MSVSDVRSIVLSIFEDLFGDRPEADLAAVTDDADLQAVLDLDSMDVVDIAMELENRLDVAIEGKPSEIRTLRALLEAIAGQP